LHARHSGYDIKQKINHQFMQTFCEFEDMFIMEISAGTDTSRSPFGIPRSDIDSMLSDSGAIVPSPYSGSRDVSWPAGIFVMNISSNVEGFTENYD
jgi:hypothetical protein